MRCSEERNAYSELTIYYHFVLADIRTNKLTYRGRFAPENIFNDVRNKFDVKHELFAVSSEFECNSLKICLVFIRF